VDKTSSRTYAQDAWFLQKEQILKIANIFEMDNLALYSDTRLPCPQRVLITAKELGIKLTIIHVDITKDDHKELNHSDPFLSL
jgi:hypothetical protein